MKSSISDDDWRFLQKFSMSVSLDVFIPTFNRPGLVEKCVKSVLSQSYSDFNIIVSDNSNNSSTEELFKHLKDTRLRYIKRKKNYTGIEHLNLILSEVESDFFVIFHDDDLMEQDMLKNLIEFLKNNEEIVAVGCNAGIKRWLFKNKFRNIGNNIVVSTPEELIYLYFYQDKFVPFPSYLYRRVVSQKVRLNYETAGKYSDVVFLLDILDFGRIAFMSNALMFYYQHSGQDTAAHQFLDKIRLIKYIVGSYKLSRIDLPIKNLRLENIYMELKMQYSLGKCQYFLSKRRLKIYYLIINNRGFKPVFMLLFMYLFGLMRCYQVIKQKI